MRAIKAIFSIGLIILIFFVLTEVFMIILEPYLSIGVFQYDRDLGFKIRAYAGGNNRFGFNDEDFPLEKRPHTFRIVVIGDSFNWAGGREWNYTVFLKKEFRKYYGDRVEVINVGYPGTHTGEQLAMLKKFALQYHPDLVFLGFFAGNDFYDADPYRKRIVVNDVFFDIDRRHEHSFCGYPVVFTSRTVHFVVQKIKIFLELDKSQTEREQEPSLLEERFYYGEKQHLAFCNLRLHEQGRWQGNVDYIFQSIDEMEEMLKAKNIKFLLGIYPAEFQVNRVFFNKLLTKYQLPKEDYDVELMQKILKAHLEEKGIYCVDLLPKFRQAGEKTPLYQARNIHWNEAGNKLAAEIIFPELVKYVDLPK